MINDWRYKSIIILINFIILNYNFNIFKSIFVFGTSHGSSNDNYSFLKNFDLSQLTDDVFYPENVDGKNTFFSKYNSLLTKNLNFFPSSPNTNPNFNSPNSNSTQFSPPPAPPLPQSADLFNPNFIDLSRSKNNDKAAESLENENYIQDLLKIKIVSDLKSDTFKKSDQKYAYNFGKLKPPDATTYTIKNAIPQQRISQRPPLEEIIDNEVKKKEEDDENEEDLLSLPSGPPIPGTEPGIEGLTHNIVLDNLPPRPQKRQDEWDCIVSQIERDKTTWKIERGRMRYNYIPKFNEMDVSSLMLSGDAKTLYKNCVATLRKLEEKSIISAPSDEEVESDFLRATFCISAAVYCYAETALGNPELQLYWNREVRMITDALLSKDPNLDLLKIAGNSLSSKSKSTKFEYFKEQPTFMPQKLPNHSFAFASTKLETCPYIKKSSSRTNFEYEGGLDAALSIKRRGIIVDDPELWTMWVAIITQKDRDVHMNLKRFKIFSTAFPIKFNVSIKPKKLSELKNVCIELLKDGMNDDPPRYELLPLAKPNKEQVLDEYCNYAADFYFGNRQWSYIYEKSLISNNIRGIPKHRPYAPFRYFAGETFNEMRINCCSVIYDLYLSKVFPDLSTNQFKNRSTGFDKAKLEKFCHTAASSYFKKMEFSEDELKSKNTDYFNFVSYKSKVNNYKTANYHSLVYEGMYDLENNPGHFSLGSIDSSFSYTPRFPNLKPSLVCLMQWKAILDQNKEDLQNNIETPTHLPEDIPIEWNMPQFSRATFRIACFRIIRKLYGQGSVSFQSKALIVSETVDDKSEKILSDFCTIAAKRYFDGLSTHYSLEYQLKIQTDAQSQWNSIVETIMRLQDKQKNISIYWVYPIVPNNFQKSDMRFINNSTNNNVDNKNMHVNNGINNDNNNNNNNEIKKLGFEDYCLEGLKTYYSTETNEILKMEVNTDDISLIESSMRQICKDAGDYFFGAIEWIWMYKFSNSEPKEMSIPVVTGLPRYRPNKPPLIYNGAGNIVLFRNYCFAFIWNMWKSGNENNLRLSGKIYSTNIGDISEKKSQLEHWCTHVANQIYNVDYKLSNEIKQKKGIIDLQPRMDPQVSLSVVEHENEQELKGFVQEFGKSINFMFGDANSQWKMILSQIEADKRRNIKRIIWLPEYEEIKDVFPGPVEKKEFVKVCIHIINQLNEKSLVQWGMVSPEYQNVVMREFCSDSFYNSYEIDHRNNLISSHYSEKEINRVLLIEFLKYMFVNKMNIKKWILFYLNENTNLNYAISWAINEDNWTFLQDYFQQSQLHEPDNFQRLFEEVRERVRQMGGFFNETSNNYFDNSPLSREKLWKIIYNQMYIDMLMGRPQRVANLPIKAPDFWLGSKEPDNFINDCKRVISRLESQTSPDKMKVKELTLKEMLTAVKIFTHHDKSENEVLESFCKDILLYISNNKGYSVFKGSGFNYPGAILEFERNRQWNIISNLSNKYSKFQQKDINGNIGAINRISNIPTFVRHTIFPGSFEMTEFITQCEIALITLSTDIKIPSHNKLVFHNLSKEEKIEDIIKDYCKIAAIYVFQDNREILDEDNIEEITVLNDLDIMSKYFKLKNPLGINYIKRWNNIIDLAKKRVKEEEYLKMNRVMKIDSEWLKNVYPKISGDDLKNAFDSKENNHLANFVLVSYELFSSILMGKEGLNDAKKEKFDFVSRNTLIQFCRDVCYKYFTDEAKGDVDYNDENKSSIENSLIYDIIATRNRLGPDPKNPLYELYPEKGEYVPELNDFNRDQYITSRWEIYKKSFDNDDIRENLRKSIMDDLLVSEINLINPNKDKNEILNEIKKDFNGFVWAPMKQYPWKTHKINSIENISNLKDMEINGKILSGETMKHMKSIFGGNIADVAKTIIIPNIPKLENENKDKDKIKDDKITDTKRILPLGDFNNNSSVVKLKLNGLIKNENNSLDDKDKFDLIDKEYKDLIENNVIIDKDIINDESLNEKYIKKGMKPRNKLNKERIEKLRKKMKVNIESSIEDKTENEIDKKNEKYADQEWTVISQLHKIISKDEGSNLVINIPIDRPKDLYPLKMGNMRRMTDQCFKVITNTKFRAITGTRIIGKTKEERKINANIYCRKASEVFYESVNGEFIPPKSLLGLPGFQDEKMYIGKSKANRGKKNRLFLTESSDNPMGKELGLRSLEKESARIRKMMGVVNGPFGINTHLCCQPKLNNSYEKIKNSDSSLNENIGYNSNIKQSKLKRNLTLGSSSNYFNRNIKEDIKLIPGNDLLTDPDYYKDTGLNGNKYIEMRPYKGQGSGSPRLGKLPRMNINNEPNIVYVKPKIDIKEEKKVEEQLKSNLKKFL